MRTLAPGLHVVEAPQRFLGLELGARMTVLELDGGLLVHSPVAVPPDTVADLGELRWVVAPNLFHHLHAGPWAAAADQAFGAPGMARKRPDLGLAGELSLVGEPFGDDVLVLPLRSFPLTNEVVLLHKPSRTLILTDLIFHMSPSLSARTRLAFRFLGGHAGCCTTVLERVGMRHELARRELRGLLQQDFDRIVLAHGDVVETGGKDALAGAFDWLL